MTDLVDPNPIRFSPESLCRLYHPRRWEWSQNPDAMPSGRESLPDLHHEGGRPMTTSTTYPLLCGVSREGVRCRKPAKSAIVQTGDCGDTATTYACGGHPGYETGSRRVGTCHQCGTRTGSAVTLRPLNEGDLPDTPGSVIMGRRNGGQEVPA